MAKSKQAVRRAQLEILKRHYLSEFEYYQIELALSKKKQDKILWKNFKNYNYDYATRLLELYLE